MTGRSHLTVLAYLLGLTHTYYYVVLLMSHSVAAMQQVFQCGVARMKAFVAEMTHILASVRVVYSAMHNKKPRSISATGSL